MMPQRCTLQPEDNTAYIQGLAHNMAPGTAIAVVLTTQPHTQRARKRNKNRTTNTFFRLGASWQELKALLLWPHGGQPLVGSNVP